MNQVKLRYARERLNDIKQEKMQAVPETDNEDELEWSEALKRLRSGTASVNWNRVGTTRDRWGHRHQVEASIEQQIIGKDNAAIAKRNKAALNARCKAQDKIRQAARKIEDELVLGNEQAAIALLDKFAAS